MKKKVILGSLFVILIIAILILVKTLITVLTGENRLQTKKNVKIPENLQIGSIVKYEPTGGTYNWEAQYASADLATDGSADEKLYSTANGIGTNMRNTTWRVFKIEEDTGKVQLIPDNPIGDVRLQGAPGYNNAIQLLDGACRELYSDSEKGITARSIDMDDIEPLLDNNALQTAKNKYNHNNTSVYSHLDSNDKAKIPYSKEYSYFPRIYEEENKSVINQIEKSAGLELSDPGSKLYSRDEKTSLINQTTSNIAKDGYFKANVSIQPYHNYYIWKYALNVSENYIDSTTSSAYSNMLNKTYWVASRLVATWADDCVFCLRCVASGNLGHCDVSNSKGLGISVTLGLCPIVTLPSNLINTDGSDFRVNS